ncbi:YidH family protein [Pseudarthrobacter sp. J1738]|uniref:YidH family protein n=1 Tax=unclassified Pseudarthrobacter TaxID=2647000 RepID=UPI003D2739B1
MREPAWRRTGTTPDYRFSLANERTFLAWLRTSLALLAGSVAIDQLAPNIAPPLVRLLLCVVLAGIGATLAVISYRRWAQTESALRRGEALPFSWILLVMTVIVALAALTFAILIILRK